MALVYAGPEGYAYVCTRQEMAGPVGIDPKDLEVCECGDYRGQHVGPERRGSCLVCRDGVPPPHGADGCQRFRPVRRETS